MEQLNQVKGTVFNIQGFSIHDGPGVRTTVFLKGCPLHCAWCQNPESLSGSPQLLVRQERCTGCGRCMGACPHGAVMIADGKAATDREVCTACGVCAQVCPMELREVSGEVKTAEEVVKRLLKDKIFYDSSNGGITISGGECLMQPEFTRAILVLSKQNGLHTAVETSGFCRWEIEKSVLEYADLVIHDLKHMDSAAHKKYTGVPNEPILENVRKISWELKKPLIIRMPVIPGVNDTEMNLRALGRFVRDSLPTCEFVQLLPYHRLGESKSEQLELTDIFTADIPDKEHMEWCLSVLRDCGVEAK